MNISARFDQHIHLPSFLTLSHTLLTAALLMAAGPALSIPTTCGELPLGSLVAKGTGGNPTDDANIAGIIRDPQPGSLSTKHLTGRIHSSGSGNSIPGGKSSAVAVDGLMYARNAGLESNLGDNDSNPVGASDATKNLRKNANKNVKTKLDEYGNTPKLKFIIAHLVHHFFNGNQGGPNNFTVTTHATNVRMKDHGEKFAIKTIDEIYNKYYKGAALHTKFVTKAPGQELYYKPGIIYQSTAKVSQTVHAYDAGILQLYNGDLEAAWPSYLIRHLDDKYKKKLASEVETRVRYILHEYRPAADGEGYETTGNWYYMPATVFTTIRDDIFPKEYYEQHGLRSGMTHILEEDTSVTVTNNGIEMRFKYQNFELPSTP